MARRWREDHRDAGTGWRPTDRARDWEHASERWSNPDRDRDPDREYPFQREGGRLGQERDDSESYRRVGSNRGYIGGEPNQGYVGFGRDQGFWRSGDADERHQGRNEDWRYRQDRPRHHEGRNERSWWDRTSDEVASWVGDEDAQRRREMDEARSHRGRGPKGYSRSDERIKEDVNDRLTDHPYINASDIEVTVSSGEVTLSGTVDSRNAKRRAEDIVEDVSGVRHVQNNLRVQAADRENEMPSGAGMFTGRRNPD
jgi:osmotically-inducible protein OsmY